MKTIRIRRKSGTKGGSNYYHHADIKAESEEEALELAKDGKVNDWRWIDTYDTSNKDYTKYVVLGEINTAQ